MSNYVKAKMAFYHDAIGTRAQNEVFEVRNAQVLSDLERAGYVEKVDSQEMQQRDQLQQQVGQKQALTNEAVSLAQHAQNVEANKHTQTVGQIRQQQQQNSQKQSNNQNTNQADTHKATAKKANEKE